MHHIKTSYICHKPHCGSGVLKHPSFGHFCNCESGKIRVPGKINQFDNIDIFADANKRKKYNLNFGVYQILDNKEYLIYTYTDGIFWYKCKVKANYFNKIVCDNVERANPSTFGPLYQFHYYLVCIKYAVKRVVEEVDKIAMMSLLIKHKV